MEGKNPAEKRVVPAESFVATLSVNVDNEKVSDKQFRQLVRNTLPIVIYDIEGIERNKEVNKTKKG